MKRTDTVTKIIIILLFLALTSYLGLYVWRYFSADYITVSAVSVPVRQTGAYSGVIIREDTALQSERPHFAGTASQGSRIAAGAVLGVSWDSADRAQLREELTLTRDTLALVQDAGGTPENVARELSLALGRGDFERAASLSVLLPEGPDSEETLQNRLLTLQATEGLTPETAPFSGLYSPAADGLEILSPALLTEDLTPRAVRDMMNTIPNVPPGCIGRLTAGVYWYIATVLPVEDADKLELGSDADLALPGLGQLRARVHLLGAPQGGELAVVFRLDHALDKSLDLRMVSVQVIFARLSGLKLPEKAVYEDETGFYIYTADSGAAVRRPIQIYDRGSGYVTAVSPDETLGEGDLILVGESLYDGMPLD